MATYVHEGVTEARKHAAQQAVDMHAGNQRPREVADQEQKYAAEKEAIESIDWEAHMRFMRGM